MTAVLNKRVLVLNKGWTPVGVVTLERALVMLFSEYNDGEPKAKIIDPTKDFQTFTWADWSRLKPKGDEDVIRGANVVFRIPEVVLLSRYNKLPQHKVHFSRRTIYKRDNNQCQYCGDMPGTELLTIEHIVPRSRGGLTSWTNCCLSCVKCNSRKADKLMEEAGMKFFNPNFKPRKPLIPLFKKEDLKIASWSQFISEIYWETELRT